MSRGKATLDDWHHWLYEVCAVMGYEHRPYFRQMIEEEWRRGSGI